MGGSLVTILFQQAIYGTFPFWDKGYAVLARSEGCHDDWITDFTHLCQSLGQPPSEAKPEVDHLILAKKLPSGPWVLAMGSAQGCDDRGRPGAWAFHGIFLSGREYRRAGASPFRFKECFIRDFHAGMQLKAGVIDLSGIEAQACDDRMIDPTLIQHLVKGYKLRLLTDNLLELKSLESIWNQGPSKLRGNRSITTWAFRPEVEFDLSGISPSRWPDSLPRKSKSMWAIMPEELQFQAQEPVGRIRLPKKIGLVIATILVLIVGLIAFWPVKNSGLETRGHNPMEPQNQAPPKASDFQNHPEPANVTAAVIEQLADWCDRLEVDQGEVLRDPLAYAKLIASALRYTGPSVAGVHARKFSRVQLWPESAVVQTDSSAVYALSVLAWCVNVPDLQQKAREISSPAEVRQWFQALRERLLPDVGNDQEKIGVDQNDPEWIEFRFHLNRVMRLK
jgi:hypothetical protein